MSITTYINRVIDLLYDKFYGIDTCEIDRLDDNRTINYEYVPSWYLSLRYIFTKYGFNPNDVLVDFGCGKGRVLIMAANHGCANAIGVVVNKRMYNQAIVNIDKYLERKSGLANISIINEDAKKFVVKSEYNKFFLYNPFHLKVLIYVLKNISNSLATCPRKIMLFLFDPQEFVIKCIENTKEYIMIEHILKQKIVVFVSNG